MLVISAAAYTAVWFYAAGRIKAELAAFAATAKAQQVELGWQSLDTGGYPFGFRLELTGLYVRMRAADGIDIAAPRAVARARPFDFDNWQFVLPNGLDAATGSRKLGAARADGAVSVRPDGGATVWLTLGKSTADTGIDALGTIAFDQAINWVILPAQPPKSPADPCFSVAVALRGVKIADPPPPFGKWIDEISAGVAVLGPMPGRSIDAWVRNGGTLQVEHSEVAWDKLDIAGKGNIAFDADLQPSGSLSVEIAGYDQLLSALSIAGLVAGSDVSPIKLGLAMIGPAVSTFLTVKDGDVYLGPLNLGKAPRIEWH